MRPQPAVCALLALTCVRAEVHVKDVTEGQNTKSLLYGRRSIDATGGCLSSGRWFTDGAPVSVRDACLRCRCAHGALSCARAACAAAPDPPPRRCALLRRRDACCPELHCPDGVKSLELSPAARLEEESWDAATPASPGHACVEDGAVFAAGSALSARAACEHCFCLRGVRRCVRPRCLPPPPGCAPRPAPAGCCPQRYYCDAHPTASTAAPRRHDCEVGGAWVAEGERVAPGGAGNCSQCFCLRGAVQCQPLACAPALRGCTPLLRAGHCCPHQYHCPHHDRDSEVSRLPTISDNALASTRSDERAFRTSASTKLAITTHTASPGALASSRSAAPAPHTAKVKRKTDDTPPSTAAPPRNNTAAPDLPDPTTDHPTPTTTSPPTTAPTTDRTEQPESSMKVIINGTINCTAELSSGVPDATTMNETDRVELESQARRPAGGAAAEQPAGAADIITESGASADFDERDSFTVNVSSSLLANTSHAAPPAPPAPPATVDPTPASAASKTAKDDYDYDYTEPTLPPSLPNLKIIPFVAADAVVEEKAPAKVAGAVYPVLAREDPFPVYYGAGAGAGERAGAATATRREDVFDAAQYPVFVSEASFARYPAPPVTEPGAGRPATRSPHATSTREQTMHTPAVNLFSPPVETEGGFVPKGPGLLDEYYAVYPSTPPPGPHLTTSMQINPNTPDIECITSEGTVVPAGASARAGCLLCACEWGELRCRPLPCRAPPPCRRRTPSAPAAAGTDPCCGDLVCPNDNATTTTGSPVTRRPEPAPTTAGPTELHSGLIPFDPPPDRSVPATHTPATAAPDPQSQSLNETTEATVAPHTAVTPNMRNASSTSKPRTEPPAITTGSTSPPSTSTQPASTPSLPDSTPIQKEINDTNQQSQEYEDEEDDEGFSFGSVLKLLLSDGYDTTTAPPSKRKPALGAMTPVAAPTVAPPTVAPPTVAPPTVAPPTLPSTTRRPLPKITPSISLPPPSYPFIPPKKVFVPNTVNRIDHLVLGEATAIRRSTVRPASAPPRPTAGPIKRPGTRAPTRRPPPAAAAPPQPALGGGPFKLAGCNIYGRMYRVGRIIAELSTPCQECRCTELGVQCAPLPC